MVVDVVRNRATIVQNGKVIAPSLEATMWIIKSAPGDKENQRNNTDQDKYRGLKVADKAMAEVIEQSPRMISPRMMSGALEQNGIHTNKMVSWNQGRGGSQQQCRLRPRTRN